MNDTSPRVEPNILIPKTIGLMNVIFGVGLMACGMCYAFYSVALPGLGKVIETQQKEEQARKVAARKADIDALKVQEAQATDEASRKQIRAEIEQIESVPPNPMVDLGFKNLGFEDRRVLGHFVADAASGLILNLLMFVAGIGLLRRSGWGRVMGLGVAWFKLLRFALLTASLLLLVRPIVLQNAEVFFRGLNNVNAPAAGGAAPGAETALREQVEGVDHLIFAFGITTALVGAIYPVLSIVLLSLPSARAACRPRFKAAGPGETA